MSSKIDFDHLPVISATAAAPLALLLYTNEWRFSTFSTFSEFGRRSKDAMLMMRILPSHTPLSFFIHRSRN